MGDPLKKVLPGQELSIPAQAYNAFVDAALAHRGVKSHGVAVPERAVLTAPGTHPRAEHDGRCARPLRTRRPQWRRDRPDGQPGELPEHARFQRRRTRVVHVPRQVRRPAGAAGQRCRGRRGSVRSHRRPNLGPARHARSGRRGHHQADRCSSRPITVPPRFCSRSPAPERNGRSCESARSCRPSSRPRQTARSAWAAPAR